MRRNRAVWMTLSDDLILEFLHDSGAAHNFQGIVLNIIHRGDSISYSTVKRRVPKLEAANLVREIEGRGSYYAITDDGRAYLRGELKPPDNDNP